MTEKRKLFDDWIAVLKPCANSLRGKITLRAQVMEAEPLLTDVLQF